MDRADHVGEPVMQRRRRVQVAIAVLALALLPGLSAAEEPTLEVVPRATRNVTPPGVTPGPDIDGPLVREVLPEPEKPVETARWRRFFLPETSDAGTFQIKSFTVRVSGVDPVPVDRMCQRADGAEWPCGRTALFSFRRFLGGRAVECYFPPVSEAREIVAPCRIGQIDIGEWLLRQGWATPNDYATDDYRAAALQGRCERHGIWQGTAADGTCPALSN